VQSRFLRTFLAVDEARSITRAADALHLAQSSVSDQIQALEAEWGATLFTRTRQGLHLTPAGEALKPYVAKILALADEARAAVDTASGRGRALTVGALETIAATRLPPLLDAFRQHHDGIAINVKVAGSGALLQDVRDGTLEAAFFFDKGQLDAQLASRVVGAEELVHIGPPGRHAPAATQRQSLAASHFIVTEQGCIYRHLFDRAIAEAGMQTPAFVSEVGSIAAIGRLVAAGMGHALVPRLVVSDLLDRGEVVELPWCGQTQTASLVMVWRRRRIQPPALKLFLETADRLGGLRPAGDLPRRAAPSLS
jgi:DNA-binding transcriptional LysR family regulator